MRTVTALVTLGRRSALFTEPAVGNVRNIRMSTWLRCMHAKFLYCYSSHILLYTLAIFETRACPCGFCVLMHVVMPHGIHTVRADRGAGTRGPAQAPSAEVISFERCIMLSGMREAKLLHAQCDLPHTYCQSTCVCVCLGVLRSCPDLPPSSISGLSFYLNPKT